MVNLTDKHFRLIEISVEYGEVINDFPINDILLKKEIIKVLNIDYSIFEKNQSFREIKVNYNGVEKTLRKKETTSEKNFFRYSTKEYYIDNISEIMSILKPGTYIRPSNSTQWKLCVTSTINQEFYE